MVKNKKYVHDTSNIANVHIYVEQAIWRLRVSDFKASTPSFFSIVEWYCFSYISGFMINYFAVYNSMNSTYYL